MDQHRQDCAGEADALALLRAELDAMRRIERLGCGLGPEQSLEDMLREAVDIAIEVAAADFGNIQLVAPESGKLRIVAQHGLPPWWVEYWQTAASEQGSCGAALSRGERVVVDDVERSPVFDFATSLEVQRRAGIRSVQSTPMVAVDGRLLGMISTHGRHPGRPSEQALALINVLARRLSVIVERTRADAALRHSRQRLELALIASEIGIWDSDCSTGSIAYDGRRFGAMLGCRDEHVPRTIADWRARVHPDDLPRIDAALRRHEQGESANYQQEYRCRHEDGHWIWIACVGKIVARDASGGASRMLGAIRDISVQKQFGAESRDLLKRMEALLGAAGGGLLSASADRTADVDALHALSRRQRQILELIAAGMSTAEIAARLELSPATIITHRRELMRRLDVHTAGELTRFALRNGIASA